MKTNVAQILLAKINEYQTIIIHRHKRPDLDCISSQMALKAFLELNFKTKKIYACGSDNYQEFNAIGKIDIIDPQTYQNSLVIVVDTANYDRIEDENFKLAKEIIKIDHHIMQEHENYGVYNFIDSHSSSCCEFLYYIFQDMILIEPQLKLNAQIAQYLFYGIYGDTGGFKFANTTPLTFKAVSDLVTYDFNYEQAITYLNTYDLHFMRIVGYAYNNIKVKNKVGYLYFSQQLQQELQIKPNQVSMVVNFLSSIKELDIWVIFNQYPSFIRVNIRSRSQYDISKVANKFNGGGHKNASGASIYKESEINDVLTELFKVVEQ